MKLQIKEAAVLELLRARMVQTEISKKLGISVRTISDIVKKLIGILAVEKISNGSYRILIGSYEIHEVVPDCHFEKLVGNIPLTHEIFIRNHYKKMTRSKLAKALKVDKLTLNFMLLQLGVGRL